MSRNKIIYLFIAVLSCSLSYANDDDLSEYIHNTKQTPPAQIEPLPQAETVKPYFYSASNNRSPFTSFVSVREEELETKDVCGQEDCSNKPIIGRVKQALEFFGISEMAMVGTIMKDQAGRLFALIKQPDGIIARTSVGDYVGKNHGLITDISPTHLSVRELVQVDDELWVTRYQKMMLVN